MSPLCACVWCAAQGGLPFTLVFSASLPPVGFSTFFLLPADHPSVPAPAPTPAPAAVPLAGPGPKSALNSKGLQPSGLRRGTASAPPVLSNGIVEVGLGPLVHCHTFVVLAAPLGGRGRPVSSASMKHADDIERACAVWRACDVSPSTTPQCTWSQQCITRGVWTCCRDHCRCQSTRARDCCQPSPTSSPASVLRYLRTGFGEAALAPRPLSLLYDCTHSLQLVPSCQPATRSAHRGPACIARILAWCAFGKHAAPAVESAPCPKQVGLGVGRYVAMMLCRYNSTACNSQWGHQPNGSAGDGQNSGAYVRNAGYSCAVATAVYRAGSFEIFPCC